MRTTPVLSRLGSLALVAAATWLSACTETVYRDRPLFNAPADKAYMGYYDVATKQTTCGNCHVGQQSDWVQTKHASAWSNLQASGSAQPFCEGCHSVNSRGNQPFVTAGYDSVKSNTYHDVQCESCHGPGYSHVQNPSIAANRPIPSINVYPSVPVADTAALQNSSCGACHTDQGPAKHHNYLNEWRASRHGQLRASQAANASCQPCHEGKGALAAWGIRTTYKEFGTSTLIPQNCVVCHDPHGSAKDDAGNVLPHQLRFPINTRDISRNLCTHCHGRVDRVTPTPTNYRGPHGSQGPVVFGDAGYWPSGSAYDSMIFYTTHGSGGNPELCAGCHVKARTGVDSAGNTITFSGHSFHPLPCLQQKTPTEVVDTTFTNACGYTVAERSWASCTSAGCHGDENVAQSRFAGIRAEVLTYTRTMWINSTKCVPVPPSTECVEAVDAFPADSGYLALVKLNMPNQLDYTGVDKNLMTAAKGAVFNIQMLGEGFAGHPDGSKGVHNPFLYRALLQANIAELLSVYAAFLPAPPPAVLSQIQGAVQSGSLTLPPTLQETVMSPTISVSRVSSR